MADPDTSVWGWVDCLAELLSVTWCSVVFVQVVLCFPCVGESCKVYFRKLPSFNSTQVDLTFNSGVFPSARQGNCERPVESGSLLIFFVISTLHTLRVVEICSTDHQPPYFPLEKYISIFTFAGINQSGRN